MPHYPVAFCRADGWQLSARVLERNTGPNDLTVYVLKPGRAPCEREPERRVPDSLVPPLYPPPGMQDGSRACYGRGWRGGAHPLAGAPALDSVLAHYSREMEVGGWRRVEATTPTVARSWERMDPKGRPVIATLVVADNPRADGCQTVTFVVSAGNEP